jgi:hypothetical protein
LSESDEFDQAEILKKIKPWIEKHGAKPQHFAEVLKYFELAKEIISSEFPPDRRTEVICAFAEVISEGHMDAETLSTLVSKIEPGEQTSENQSERNGYTGVAFFHQAKDGQGAKVILLEEFFQQDEAGTRKYNLAHMLKHEIGHSLIRYGEIVNTEEMSGIKKKIRGRETENEDSKISAEVNRILDQADSDQDIQTYHLKTVLEGFSLFKLQEGVSAEQIQDRAIRAANQILAEKIGIYLSSNGEFNDFLRANIAVTSDENLNNIFGVTEKPEIKELIKKITQSGGKEQEDQITELQHQCPGLARFIESNRIFFDLVSERLADKEALKEKIKNNIAQKPEMIDKENDSEEDFYGYYDQGFYEPGTPANNQSSQSKGQRDSFWSTAIELAGAISKEVEEVTPVTELTKSKAA